MYLLTHSLVLVLVAVMKPKVLKTKISHADPPTLSCITLTLSPHSLTHSLSPVLVVVMGSMELKTSRSLMLILSSSRNSMSTLGGCKSVQ